MSGFPRKLFRTPRRQAETKAIGPAFAPAAAAQSRAPVPARRGKAASFSRRNLMERRALLLGGLAAFAAVPALAQTGGSSSTTQPGASGMNRMGGQMDPADMHHMEQTMQLGMVALETSRVAMNKAQ